MFGDADRRVLQRKAWVPEGRRRTSGCARSRGRSSRTCTGPRDNVRAEVIRRTPAKAFIARYQATLQASGRAVKPAAKKVTDWEL